MDYNIAYDYYNMKDRIVIDVYSKMLNKETKRIRLRKINPSMYKTALRDFMKFGKVTRYPTKYIEQWKEIIIYNTIMLDFITELYGHTNYFDVDLFNDMVLNSDYTDISVRDWHEAMEYLEKEGYADVLEELLPKFSNGHYFISDYGLKPLQEICYDLLSTNDHSEILVLINKAMNISHQRSDLSEIFIEGGYKSLDWISNVNESIKTYNNIRNLILEYISENKNDLYYHGTSNLGHDDFNKNHINYFTKDYNYALNYTHPSYSAIAGKKEDYVRGVYVVKLNCSSVFNTRDNPSHREIFEDYTNTYGNRTPIGDLGFPDWTDAERLVDYFEDKNHNFDCVILHDAHSVISYATIGKDKVEIVDRIVV